METLLEDVSAAAYDKAVEVVTDVVRTETRKEDMRMIEDTKKWVLSPERKAPQATREYAAHRLATVLDKFLKTMQTTATRLQDKLLKPEVRQKGKEQVKEKARDSVLQLLSRLQAEQAQNKPTTQPAHRRGTRKSEPHRERLGQKAGTFCPGTRLQGIGGASERSSDLAKSNLTLEEAAAYSGIGINKLRSMTDSDECKFVLWNGTKRLIKRRKLDEYLDKAFSI